MDKRGGSRSILISLIVIVLIVIVLLIYFSLSGPSTDVNSSNCKIEPAFKTMNLHVGVATYPPVKNYQGTLDQVSWTTVDSNIAIVNPYSGPYARVEAKSVGSTYIIATDNAVNDYCKTSIEIVVEE